MIVRKVYLRQKALRRFVILIIAELNVMGHQP